MRRAAALAFALGCALGINAARGDLNRRYDRARKVLDDAQIPGPTVGRLVSLGHTEWMVDILWINATLYYSDSLYARLPSRYLRRYADVMTTLDPRFRAAYLWGALALAYRTTRVEDQDVRDAVALLRRGLQRFPDDPELLGQLGVYLAIELAPRLPEGSDEARLARREAGESLRRACELGWGPALIALRAATLLVEDGRTGAALELLRVVLLRSDDPQSREQLETRIARLVRAQPDADAVTASLRALDSARRAEAPWMSPMLYVFAGGSPLQRSGRRGAL